LKVDSLSSTGSPGWSRKEGRKTVVVVWWLSGDDSSKAKAQCVCKNSHSACSQFSQMSRCADVISVQLCAACDVVSVQPVMWSLCSLWCGLCAACDVVSVQPVMWSLCSLWCGLFAACDVVSVQPVMWSLCSLWCGLCAACDVISVQPVMWSLCSLWGGITRWRWKTLRPIARKTWNALSYSRRQQPVKLWFVTLVT